ncbi:MAG: toxin-antitoxin system YwqK family antitoxin, partial [Fusobacteriaceae bacterium]|nr:toxin-antitoxin system YwqK family antitoxin [Fusobacteriaceae bacterium]
MRKVLMVLLLIGLTLSGKVVNSDQLVKKDGVWYEEAENQPFTGLAKGYYSDGKLRTELTFRDGVPDGPSKGYYVNGKLRSEGNFEKDKKAGVWQHYFENGAVQIREEYNGDKCVVRDYFENGNLSMERHIEGGKLNGPLTWYYENGALNGQCNFTEDVAEGIETRYFEDGKTKKSEYEYVQGNITGKGIEYYPNGKQAVEAHYVDAKKDGPYKGWFESGQLAVEIDYKAD